VILDWEQCLKPNIQQRSWDMSFLESSHDEADDTTSRLNKRQQVDTSYISPDTSQSDMPPPPTLPKQDTSPVKTPRPDITVGLRHSTVIEALKAQGLGQNEADEFLDYLQSRQILCSNPAQQALPIRFPPIVVEGKSYATGKPVFEAQNQASVSGSCMTNLQHKLADLAASASRGSYRSRAPLAFSICTEGPHIELWMHYTVLVDGVRTYIMKIVKTCHASLQEGVVEFLTTVDNVMIWATTEYMKDIVEQLVLVEEAGRVQNT
jgi:hypothetical protein